ncbi:MAG: hypothetical protein ACR2O4_09200 [Hyphomicrobiaceae bacterium]
MKFNFGGAIAACLAVVWTAPAQASDYYHECATPGGEYRMHDETLFTGQSDNEKQREYKVLSKTVLSETEGYCIARSGRRYGFNSARYILRVEVPTDDEPVKLIFYCELAADGLPANEVCDKPRNTKTKRLVPAYETRQTIRPDDPAQ